MKCVCLFIFCRPGVQLGLLPFLVAIMQESSKQTGVQVVQNCCQEIFVELKCVGELLRHLGYQWFRGRGVNYFTKVSQPARHSRSTEGRLGSSVHRCVCHHRGQHAGQTCGQSSAILSLSEPASTYHNYKYYHKLSLEK